MNTNNKMNRILLLMKRRSIKSI